MWSTRSPASVGETQRHLETRVKEHRDACNKGDTGKSAIAEHQWDQHYQVKWEGTMVLDRTNRPVQHRVKEALYIQKTPANNRLNCDKGYELPGCWIATMKKLGGGVSSSHASTNCLDLCTGPHTCASSGATPINCHHFHTSLHHCPEYD